MERHFFRVFVEQFVPLSLADWHAIEACLVREEVGKGKVLLEEGRICKKLWFLESGLLRFFVNREGIEVTKFFTEAPYCLTSQRSFTQQIPAMESIETLEDSVLYTMTREDAFELLKMPSWSDFVRQLTQEVQFFTEQILVDLQNRTAEERYRELLENGSPLLQRVPLKHLATYLGIAPQSLSRIRRNLVQALRT